MWSKIIFFVGVLCAVNASVITIKVYVDDEEGYALSKGDSSVHSCNNQECDQRCRRLRFPGGVCVNGRCKCDNFLATDFSSIIQEYVLQRMCQPRDCNEKCQSLGHPGGVCVNGHCKCYRFTDSEESDDTYKDYENEFKIIELDLNRLTKEALGLTSSEKTAPVRSCNNQECDQRCRRLQFPGGVCVNGRCKCDDFLATNENNADNNEEDEFNETVEPLNKIAEDVAIDNEVSESKPTNPFKCKQGLCDQLCRSLGFESGTCVDGRCKCNKKASIQ